MAASWSCKIVYSSDEEQEIYDKTKDTTTPPSVSRPLRYAITMSSGSSGADTFSSMSESDSLSFSEPSTRAGTPPETPAAVRSGKSLLSPPLQLFPSSRCISPLAYGNDLEYDAETESSFAKLALDSGGSSPWEERGEDAAVGRNVSWDPRIKLFAVDASEEQGTRGLSDACVLPDHREDLESESVDLPVPPPTLRRSRLPPPLDLSSISYPQAKALREIPAVPFSCDSPSTPVRRPYTAPLIHAPDLGLSVELVQPLVTAPPPIMPRAPRIRPSVPALEPTPSPLLLPSPCIPWSLDESLTSTASTPSTLWSPTSPSSASPVTRGRKGVPKPRRVSLSQKIATLRQTSARAPIPPSLQNSPILAQVCSPRMTSDLSPVLPAEFDSFGSGILLSPVQNVGTPLRVPMNPYFAHETLAAVKGERVSSTNFEELEVCWPVTAADVNSL